MNVFTILVFRGSVRFVKDFLWVLLLRDFDDFVYGILCIMYYVYKIYTCKIEEFILILYKDTTHPYPYII
jgi:hypothetical protein